MPNIAAGVKTARYWLHTHRHLMGHGQAADASRLLAELRRASPAADAALAALRRDGVFAIPDYWPAEKCAGARREIDRLISAYPDAVQHASSGSDKRMFGVESVSALLADFHHDAFLRQIGELAYGYALYNFATLGARIDATDANNGSGDGWHRDWHGYQFKSILYLSDVTEDNGPFEYLPGSHKTWRAVTDTILGDLPPAPGTRYEPAIIERLAKRAALRQQRFAGPAGTLLLADTSGIHRGRPLRQGTRYALTNYYYFPFEVGERKIEHFSPLMPGTAERIRADIGER